MHSFWESLIDFHSTRISQWNHPLNEKRICSSTKLPQRESGVANQNFVFVVIKWTNRKFHHWKFAQYCIFHSPFFQYRSVVSGSRTGLSSTTKAYFSQLGVTCRRSKVLRSHWNCEYFSIIFELPNERDRNFDDRAGL